MGLPSLACLGLLLGASPKLPPPSQRFPVVYEEPTSPGMGAVAALMKERRALETVAEMLAFLKLPRKLTLKAASCGESNAWFDSETEVVTFCYEMADEFIKAASADHRFGLTEEQATAAPFLFIMFHETAHAIFTILDVPVLGREEDAADQVATLVAIRLGGNFAERMLRGAALMYHRDSAARKVGEDDFADVHGLDRQRYYNVLCIAWGSDPKRFAWAQDEGHLPADRAEGCADEFAQVAKAVRRLIGEKAVDQATAKKVKQDAAKMKFGR
ncbi:MAG TPA: DUF4344 domain-containing metallopeptidase [Myxococcaceae bacterium]|nr:DUF4344 domain-containing metallopeptidase [Myxococcaceae bacterium]